ncbi:outer membrane protein assembly factor BamA [Acidihalobacter ferrooxydans]|uniref:Outer membrane protein assembly factor BamA n=1 Tax=Acidihalobacter ferrooxydans TaxID=1765967 RepID=A0A1P8ULC0_9GAMM|nr:outer membrane protein assembly factor BamA [Acidihalobacter ferrooxydans]
MAFSPLPAAAATATIAPAGSFKIANIELRGLQRISPSTVFAYLPVHVGEEFQYSETPKVIDALYGTGFFSRVNVYRQGNVLIVDLKERPAINDIRFRGNSLIKTAQLKRALKQAGIAKGLVFKRDVLNELRNELLAQYYGQGKYNVKIDTTVKPLPRNRVDIDIHIIEGKTATIKQVVVVGNHAFREQHLLGLLDVGTKPWWEFWSSRNKYSQARLSSSLNTLQSQYLNDGYINFALNSTQVALTPNHRNMYITINVHEGEKYSVKKVSLAGKLLYPKAQLMKLLKIKPGEVFSRKQVLDSVKALQNLYGDNGYAFANINPVPQVDQATHEVSLTFFVDPGRRVYVHEIHFIGNNGTSGNVLRREMRQMEGGLYSTKLIDLSKRRLQRLPYIESVKIDTQRVAGSDDQVNLNVHVKERLSSSFTASIGYSQFDGITFATGISSQNFLGTGNSLNLSVNTSRINTLYQINYINPYYTINGVSRGINLYYQRTDTASADIIDYNANRLGMAVSYGIPLSEFNTLNASYGYQQVKVTVGTDPAESVTSYIADYGSTYNLFKLGAGLTHDTRNRTVFPTSGNYQGLNLSLITPGSTVKYYKVSYFNDQYIPLSSWLTGVLNANVSYGAGYDGTRTLPFFDKYYAGGMGSVAGYKDSSLGPRDPVTGQPTGGNFLTTASAGLRFPAPFLTNSNSVRMSLFYDIGNVFASARTFKANQLRSSVGLGLEWLSPIGPLSFSIAKPLNAKPGDQTQTFQFNIGTYF